MNKKNDRGSALVLVIVSAMFLIILTGALYTYLKSNVETQIWTRERIQAKLSAEAGVNLATHMLVAGAELPSHFDPQDILGSPTSFEVLPGGMGSVYASVDPYDSNKVVTSANAFQIRCLAQVPGTTVETWGMESIIMPENLARFSVFMNSPSTAGYYGDGYRFDGPFYANGPISIYSSSPTHANDPFFYSLHLTSDYYLYGQGVGGTQASTPAIGNLQMQPFHRLSMGAPYFEMGVDPIPFGPDELNWQGVRNAALSGGLVLDATEIQDRARMRLEGTSLYVKNTQYGADVVYDLSVLENPVVWIENDDDDRVYLRGNDANGVDMALTIGMNGDLYMSGKLMYANRDLEDPDNRNLLGIISVYGDLVIAHDPGLEAGWVGHHIVTDEDFEYDCVLVALSGRLQAENWGAPPAPGAEFMLVGGYMIDYEHYTGYGDGRGYRVSVYFDPRLLSMHPPFFPTTANWLTIMWRDRHDMTVQDVEDGLPPY